jgi:Lrp/AsnC family transcriptional regulator
VVVDAKSIPFHGQQWFANFSFYHQIIKIQCYKFPMKKKLDAINRQLLAILQTNAETPLAELAEAVNLSSTPCWRRLQMLREAGYITKQVALVDPAMVNLGVTVFVAIKTNQHNATWLQALRDAVQAIPEIVEFYRMSGDVDYLLRVVVPDIRTYDTVYKRLIKAVPLSDVSSSFAMEELKFTTALPLDYAD